MLRPTAVCRMQTEFQGWAHSAALQHGYSVAFDTLGHACLEEDCGLPGPLPAGATQAGTQIHAVQIALCQSDMAHGG